MSYIIPDSRFEMPALLDARRKPYGRVVIGTKSGIWRDCQFALINDTVDTVSNRQTTTAGPASVIPTQEHLGWWFDNTSKELYYDIPAKVDISQPWTLWARTLSNFGDPSRALSLFAFIEDTSNLEGVGVVKQTNGTIKIASEGETPGSGSAYPTTKAAISMSWDGTQFHLYIDGILDYSVTATGTAWQTSNRFAVGEWNDSGIPTEFYHGWIENVFMWNRELSIEEQKRLALNEYVDLEPE